MRICNTCGIEKPMARYKKDTRYNGGHRPQCRDCANKMDNIRRKGSNFRASERKYRNTFKGFCKQSYNGAKARAKKYSLEFDLPNDYFEALWLSQNGKCALSNRDMEHTSRSKTARANDYRASIDRIDSSKGYTVDNVRLICWYINEFKKDRSDEQLKGLVLELAEVFRKNT